MRIRTETRTVTVGVHGPHAVELCVDDNNGIEVCVLLTSAEAYMLAGAMITSAEHARSEGVRAEMKGE